MIFKKLNTLEAFKAADHTRLIEVLHPKNDSVQLGFSLAWASLDPGEASLPHILEKSSETYYFLKGVGTIYIEDDQQKVEAEDVILVPEGAVQYVENQGDERLEFLCIVSPPWRPEEENILDGANNS